MTPITPGVLFTTGKDQRPSLGLALVAGAIAERIVEAAPTEMAVLASFLKSTSHMVLQVSSSGAAVAGDYDREVNVRTILEYGDFGLDELISLDGNDGAIYPGCLAIVAQRRRG